jgi:hypothetical protein
MSARVRHFLSHNRDVARVSDWLVSRIQVRAEPQAAASSQASRAPLWNLGSPIHQLLDFRLE